MSSFPKILEELIELTAGFPGIGKKSAERIVFSMIRMDPVKRKKFSAIVSHLERYIKTCKICNNFSVNEVCGVCSSGKRNKRLMCVVEEPKDVLAVEKTGVFNGVYHVLLGALSPLEGKGPESLDIKKLKKRIEKEEIEEVIIATDSDAEGEATALYLFQNLPKQHSLRLSRLSIGVPVGMQLEYIDTTTLQKAFLERRDFS